MTMSSRWVNPPKKQKTESEFPYLAYPQNVFPPQDSVIYIPPTSFNTIKKQVRKKRISKKSKEQRIADKSISLAERLGNGESEKTI